jgi:hypothetical protein
MKTILKAHVPSTIMMYISYENGPEFMSFLRMIEELDMGRALTDDDRKLRTRVSTHFSSSTKCAKVTMSVLTFNTLYNNRK